MAKDLKKLDESFIAKIKAKLSRQKEVLEKEISKLSKEDPFLQEDRPMVTSEPGKAAMEYEGHERIEIVRSDLKKALNQVKKALAAIVQRRYGKCERCGKPIDVARLKVMPEATLCLACERDTEKFRQG